MERARYFLGVVTLLFAAVGGVYLFQLLGDEDDTKWFALHVELHDVEGLRTGADVKYRGVLVGSVRRVDLREDGKKGVATVVLKPGLERLARTNTSFWIVRPRFGGLATGASGLETLVRDAYVSFYTPDSPGAQLAHGSSVAGVERPVINHDDGLEPVVRGDLLMTLLVAENHGLAPGARVRFRGVETGDIRKVELAVDGTHVRVQLRIDRRYRRTVTDKTKFWVARPRLSGNLLQAISVEDVSALLVPFVSYYTEPGEGLPVSDGHVVAAEVNRPDITLEKLAVDEGTGTGGATPPSATDDAVQLVQVVYEAVEEDWLSADDQIRREGTGVLFEDSTGRLLVVTARTCCDASYFDTDAFGGGPDIVSEGVKIVMTDGVVLRANRIWVDENDADIAVLAAEDGQHGREGIATTPAKRFRFDGGSTESTKLSFRFVNRERKAAAAPTPAEGKLPPVAAHRGAAGMDGENVVAILGQQGGGDTTAAVAPVTLVPEALRPTR